MRATRIVPVLLAAAALLLWAAPAGAAAPRIVCPLLTTCCPLPVATPVEAIPSPSVCCEPASTFCLASPTIGSASDPSVAGRQVTVSGLIPGAGSGTQVTLWQRLAGEASFESLATTATSSSGQYTFLLAKGTVQTNREWYVTASGRQSATIDQQVQALVTLTHSLHVRVSPDHAGERVWLEQREGAAWTVIARARLNGSSSAVMSAAFSANHRVKLRAVLPGDRRNIASYSPAIYL